MADSVERLEFDIYARDRGASRTFDEVARSADHAGDSFGGLGKDSSLLDKKITETETHLRELIAEFEKTDDVTLLKEVRRDKSTLSLLQSMRKEVEKLNSEVDNLTSQAGVSASSSVGDILGSLPSQLKGAAIAAAIAVGPFIAPALGAAVSGAVVGGVGIGGVVGGIVAAARDVRVAEAWEQLAQNFLTGFKDSGLSFVNPIIDQLGRLQHTSDIFISDLTSGFAKLAPAVSVVVDGLEGFAENLDLDQIFGDSLPELRAFANELPALGDAISEALKAMTDEEDGTTEGLIALLHAVEDFIVGAGEFIGWLAGIFDLMVRTDQAITRWALDVLDAADAFGFLAGALGNAQLDVVRDHLQSTNDEMTSLIDSTNKAKDAGDDWSGSTAQQARTLQDAAEEAKAYEDAISSLFNKIIGLKDAQLAYNEDLLKVRAELKEGAKTLAINTEEGQKNQRVILDLIRDIKALREEHIANNVPVARANQLYEQQMNQLIDLAVQYGFSRKEVERFAGELRAVPDTVDSWVTVHNLDPSLKHAQQLNKQIDELDGKVAKATVITEFAEYRAGERNPDGKKASGGPVMSGRSYLVGENGPEVVTMSGSGYVHDAASTRAMLSGASGGSAGPMQVEVTARFEGSGMERDLGEALMKFVRFQVRTVGGGDVQSTYGRET